MENVVLLHLAIIMIKPSGMKYIFIIATLLATPLISINAQSLRVDSDA